MFLFALVGGPSIDILEFLDHTKWIWFPALSLFIIWLLWLMAKDVIDKKD